MRVAFAGSGMVSELHHRALSGIPTLELAGLFDIDPAVSERRAAQWGVRAYPTLDALLDDGSVDAVLVLTDQAHHVPVATRAVEAGKHVLVEKPVSSDPAEIRRLVELAKARGVVAMPGHNYCHVPEFARAVRLVRGGELGRVRSVFVVYAIAHPEEIAGPYGGVMGAVMVHHSYLVLALLGAPDRVHAGMSETAWADHDGEDQAWMTWSYDDGAVAHLSASFAVGDDSVDPWTTVVKVLGTEGSAAVSFRSSYVRRAIGTLSFGIPVYEESYQEELRAFAVAIEHGTPPVSTMNDAAMCAEILRGAYAAAETGRPWVRE
jgi:predicted dehydrogenase